jgi:outer membrane immunogenic protein
MYLGGQGGLGWGPAQFESAVPDDVEGLFTGGLAGVQKQWDTLVLGAEGELNWSDVGTGFRVNQADIDVGYFGSVGAKVGLAVDRLLLYGLGGVSFANIEYDQIIPVLSQGFSLDRSYVGWSAGGGIDYALTDRVVVGGRYRYYDFGSEVFLPDSLSGFSLDTKLQTATAHIAVKLF